ncbi:hydantoinase/oxoprolinase family protein [Vineibacter terrae]|uniref:hydantoinase/oxoprolinase family protein n=1 Tax=Vineibacter terrae TaxID=2586908 RepID=UPI002E320598|nr:hydantoinase/oxoprolinase family protein [Vineibacter terrae]HEX2891612.1 hydantoinase/oxoprolinase family protein [Vineibacter terrae]
MSIQIAFDVGGTFTDFAFSREDRIGSTFLKVPTTYPNPADGVLAGIAELLRLKLFDIKDVDAAFHATTIATNAVLERKGARVALLTTKGFRDILIIGRQKRPQTYLLNVAKPAPLVQRRAIMEVDERTDPDGAVRTPVDPGEIAAIAGAIEAGGYEAVAICFLHSYANARNERLVAQILGERLPGVRISLSSEISPKIREYERTSTTVADAYVAPAVNSYISQLRRSLVDLGAADNLQIMQSNGGLISQELACQYPVRIIESGPAAGVLMCAAIGRAEGVGKLLTFDMGGTTAKLGAIDDGEPAIVAGFEVDVVDYKKGSGLPLNISSIELVEIGAGGGSIASAEMNLLTVGPRSAASRPGPACYGKGGTLPTVTDANLVLGYIGSEGFNGGAMRLDRDAARAAIDTVAKPLSLSIEQAAWGIHALSTNNMERALRIVSIERGRDPRDYTLVAFGGAGPLHAARLARQAAVRRMLVPFGAGVGSAMGLLAAVPKLDALVTRILPLALESASEIDVIYTALAARLAEDAARLGAKGAARLSRIAYMRYQGQGFEIKVGLDDGPIDESFIRAAQARFADAYRRIYGGTVPDSRVEVTDWQLVWQVEDGRGRRAEPALMRHDAALPSHRDVYFPELGGYVKCPLHWRSGLSSGTWIDGPAIIVENETSTVLLPGDRAEITAQANIHVHIGKDGA